MNPNLPTFAIVGRPNVGKSALFNRITGKRIAVVHEVAGTTRDRIEAPAYWGKTDFRLVDTGGIGWLSGETMTNDILGSVRQQVEHAANEADVFLFVVDAHDGIVPMDQEVAKFLRKITKPIFLVVNKADNENQEAAAFEEFSQLGYPQIFPVSATHGIGLDLLLTAAVRSLPREKRVTEPSSSDDLPLKISIIGRPNVGKSSLVNKLLQEERLIVSPIAGTTRDSVDVPFYLDAGSRKLDCILIDTAGIRRTGKINTDVDFFSVKRAEQSIGRSDLSVLMLDAEQGITRQDKVVGGKITEAGKGCVVAVNKWDLVKKPVQAEFLEHVSSVMFFLDFAPVVFLSAKTGEGLGRLTDAIVKTADAGKQMVATGPLNRLLVHAAEKRSLGGGWKLKIFYATQKKTAPPTFILFVNDPRNWSPAAEKSVAKLIRAEFGFQGWPLRFDIRMKKKVELAKKKESGKFQASRPQKTRGAGAGNTKSKARARDFSSDRVGRVLGRTQREKNK